MHKLNSKRMVLVTGGTGFFGAYIARELVEKGYTVRILCRSNHQPAFIPPAILAAIEWRSGDVLDVVSLQEAMEGVDSVIHAAGMVSYSSRDRRELLSINIEGTANVVNMALEQNVNRFIHISSVAALGRTGKDEQVTEENKWNESKWNTNYAISKFYGEVEVWRAIGEGLPAAIVNPSILLGYGDWNSSSCTLFRSAFREFPWYTGGINGFVDVTDAARAVVGLLEGDSSGQRYILNGDNWSYRRLFENMADGFGKKRPSREATPFLAGVAWRMARLKSLFTGESSMLTRESAKVARSSAFFDNTKILQELPGFHFTPLEETIKRACAAYLSMLKS